MNKSQRIPLNIGEDYNVKIRLEQEVDSFEFLSMEITADEVYQDFNADYGVLIGRVVANGAVGIPNAKISIFIPVADDDLLDADISSVYPYKTPRDKNNEGKRYNLLPRVSKKDKDTQQPVPKQAFGSFPIKEEIVTNPTLLDVYKKYYKYTATTNDSGDYMIFGVPIGTQTVHLSVDITDIGKYSMNPAAMVRNLGYSEANFTDNNTRIKESSDLNDLPNIETQEISVDVIPFWGDVDNFEIGITRQDFRIRAKLENTFIVFGSAFTDAAEVLRGYNDGNEREIRDLFNTVPNDELNEGYYNSYGSRISTKRIGKIRENIYYYPNTISDADISSGAVEDNASDMQLLNEFDYSTYKRNGDFVYIISCNRNKVITNEYGEEVEVDESNQNGIYTKFKGFFTLEYEQQELQMTGEGTLKDNDDTNIILPYRTRLKFPQYADEHLSFNYTDQLRTWQWRKQHKEFESGKYYSFSRFHGLTYNNNNNDNDQFIDDYHQWGFFNEEIVNDATKTYSKNVGNIYLTGQDEYEMVPNYSYSTYGIKYFGANWLNLSIYLPQLGYTINSVSKIKGVRTVDYLHPQGKDTSTKNDYFVTDNSMPIAAGQVNTKWFARSDLHWTDIIEVPFDDIVKMNVMAKGFTDQTVSLDGDEYRDGASGCPYDGGKISGNPANSVDPRTYFYKGFGEADCIKFLYDLKLIE